MHVADQSKQVCLRTSSDRRHLTATPCVSRSGEVVCMQIVTREKAARSHADLARGCPPHDAMYQDPTPPTTLFFAVSSTRSAIHLRTGRSWSLWGLCLWWLRPP